MINYSSDLFCSMSLTIKFFLCSSSLLIFNIFFTRSSIISFIPLLYLDDVKYKGNPFFLQYFLIFSIFSSSFFSSIKSHLHPHIAIFGNFIVSITSFLQNSTISKELKCVISKAIIIISNIP